MRISDPNSGEWPAPSTRVAPPRHLRPSTPHRTRSIATPARRSSLTGSRSGCETLLPTIALTSGDPSGIGPEIAVKAASDPRVTAVCQPVIYGPHRPDEVAAFPVGQISAESGRAAHEAIVAAVRDALARKVAAIATAPIHKSAFYAAGYRWPGHTELLAELCSVSN